MAGLGVPSLATRSARGGTTGRAAGCPTNARPVVKGIEPPVAGAGADAAAPGPGVPAALGRPTTTGLAAVPGMAAPGPETRMASAGAVGNGWRGPERICPGRGEEIAGPGNGLAAGIAGRPGAITAAGGACGGGAAGAARGPSGRGTVVPAPATGGWIGLPGASGGRMGAALPGVAFGSSTAVLPAASAAGSWGSAVSMCGCTAWAAGASAVSMVSVCAALS
jgi:hypothetical protein